MANKEVSSGGIGFMGLLGLLLIGLKLTGYINWAWWLVTAPLWIGVVIALGIFLVIMFVVMVVAIVGIVANVLSNW